MGVEIAKNSLAPGEDMYGNAIAGVETIPRQIAGIGSLPTMSSQTLRLSYFTPQTTTQVSTSVTVTGGTAAGATPTRCRVGLYLVETNGDLTLVASTANDTTLWSATTTEYAKALSDSYVLTRGRRYAAGVLCVTGATAPALVGVVPTTAGALLARAPRVTALVSSQSDLPSSIPSGSLTNSTASVYVAFV